MNFLKEKLMFDFNLKLYWLYLEKARRATRKLTNLCSELFLKDCNIIL